jgi:hypothetical protein
LAKRSRRSKVKKGILEDRDKLANLIILLSFIVGITLLVLSSILPWEIPSRISDLIYLLIGFSFRSISDYLSKVRKK